MVNRKSSKQIIRNTVIATLQTFVIVVDGLPVPGAKGAATGLLDFIKGVHVSFWSFITW
jgi:hypothetical protein